MSKAASGKARWTKGEIVAALRDRQARGLAMTHSAVRQSGQPLAIAIKRCFVSFDAALHAAGIRPAAMRPRRRPWDKDGILAILRDRHAKGLPMNASAIYASASSLRRPIKNFFGSHDAALRAAGIDPQLVRLYPPRFGTPADPDIVRRMLKERHARGEAMDSAAIRHTDPRLSYAIYRHWRTLKEALNAAGIDLQTVRIGGKRWDKETIIAALRDRQAQGLAMNTWAIYRSNHKLYSAMSVYFGSYEAALRAVGIDPATVRLRRKPLTKGKIIAALRRRHAKGLPVNLQAVRDSDNALSQAIPKRFGSHDAALRAAGIDPNAARKQRLPWDIPADPDWVVRALQARHARGAKMSTTAIRRTHPRLAAGVYRHWNTMKAALQAAGIDLQTVRIGGKRWDKETIITALRDRRMQGLAMNSSAVGSSNLPLHGATIRYFGSFDAALLAAGIDPSVVRLKKRRDAGARKRRGDDRAIGHWTDDTVLQSLLDLHDEGYDLRYSYMKQRKQPIFYAAKKLFGSYVNAVREAGINYWAMTQAQLAKARAAATETDE